LNNELRKMFKSGKVGKRFADVLVKVHLKDGSTQCIFIHIEVKGNRTRDCRNVFMFITIASMTITGS
jgi:hypothetical protein